ncbi:MAG: DUF721 domain-containing protein [Xanthomonadales bacterium]|nr:DUF721 domain-containing protein [Xanthomonadales bacterium]
MPPSNYSKKRGARTVNAILGSRSGRVGEILSQARAMAGLEQKLARLLDAEMAEQVRVATVRQGVLVLVTPSAALATRLKMDQVSILKSLNASAGLNLTGLQVRTAPIPRSRKLVRRPRKVPSAAREVFTRFKD